MEVKTFSFRSPGITIFGRGTSEETGPKAKQLGARKVSIITDRNVVNFGIAEKIVQSLRSVNLEVNLFDEIEGEPDIEMIENCVRAVKKENPEVIVGLGGGSCMDAAKIVAVLLKYGGQVHEYIGTERVPGKGLPVILLPTTAGTGAEATPNAIVTNKSLNLKQAVVSTYLLPDVAIIDPSFTDTLPPKITAFTGVDAFTHAFECYICKKASPLTDIITL
ncbi:iron-containing alcohol dehydrogenase, partial [Candidatus Aerophobetes bacterium]|nr:iron-containing alcohol dehydrogenase [Candidatus Aerophobetes bacterium]